MIIATSAYGQNLTVQNGYGSGQFENGEKTNIWSKQIDGKVFTHWSGDIQYLETPNEYHSIVNIPDKNISVTANYGTLLPYMKMYPITVQGAQKPKACWAYFPPNKNDIKGVIWLFHGTNGNATNMVNDIESQHIIQYFMVNNYGVVAITSEESEFQIDLDNDGKFRYSYSVDSTLIDQSNVRAIRDSMISNNLIFAGTPHIAIGYSAGGSFSENIAQILKWKAAINHTSAGLELISLSPFANASYISTVNVNDNHPEVGTAGNEKAKLNVNNYLTRGACAIYHVQPSKPLYPERFDRSTEISESLSRDIFNELKSNSLLDANNYLKYSVPIIEQLVINNPSKFPIIVGLSLLQKSHIVKQLEVTRAEHVHKADINGLSREIIENACKNISALEDEVFSKIEKLLIFPNPVFDVLRVNGEVNDVYHIITIEGRKIDQFVSLEYDASKLEPGIYFIKTSSKIGKFVKM